MKYKVQSGVRGPFQSTWYFSPLGAFITTPEPKGRPTGMICYTDPQKNCQPEVLSVPSPPHPREGHWVSQGGGTFPPRGQLFEPEEAYGVWGLNFSFLIWKCPH